MAEVEVIYDDDLVTVNVSECDCSGGSVVFDCADLIGCNISNLTNDSGYITNSALAPYLTSATAAATYQPIGSYLTTISGLNISLLNNDSGYITSAALSGYVPTSRTLTINGVAFDLSADRTWTVSASVRLNELLAANGANTIGNGANVQTWNWSGLGTNVRGLILGGTDILVNGLTVGRGRAAVSNNTAFGVNTLNANTTGSVNVAIGNTALQSNTTGTANTAVGAISLFTNTTGEYNTSVGYAALYFNNGIRNTAVGTEVLQNNTGSFNVGIGNGAGSAKTTGDQNVFIGNVFSVGANRGCNYNTLIGYGNAQNITSSNNTTLGYQALLSHTSGGNNIAIGYQAGSQTTTSANSVFIGSSTGASHATKDNIILLSDGAGNERLMIESDGRVGIGTTSPSTSAKLHVTSTTQGFVLTPMTATQASAITPVEGLELNVSDTNGTFTSIGKWQYIGGAWVKL